MRLGEALYREITGGRSPHTEVNTFGGAVEWYLFRGGSIAGAARLAGVPPSTFRGWVHGRQPKPGRAGWLVRAAQLATRRARLSLGRERRLRRPGALAGLTIVGEHGYDRGKGFARSAGQSMAGRTVKLGVFLDEVQNDVVDVYLAGGSMADLAEALHAGINDRGWYAQTFDPYNVDGEVWDIDDLTGWA